MVTVKSSRLQMREYVWKNVLVTIYHPPERDFVLHNELLNVLHDVAHFAGLGPS